MEGLRVGCLDCKRRAAAVGPGPRKLRLHSLAPGMAAPPSAGPQRQLELANGPVLEGPAERQGGCLARLPGGSRCTVVTWGGCYTIHLRAVPQLQLA
jgi:hypothetical protein